MPFGRRRRLDRSVRERGVAPEVEIRHRNEDRDPTEGPFDEHDVPDDGVERVDFGAVLLPKIPGQDIRVGLDGKGRLMSVTIHRDGSAMQIGVFAAPRAGSVWEDLRPELSNTITGQGGAARDEDGPFGPELHAELAAAKDSAGSAAGAAKAARTASANRRPARFIGVDGPRWFLRAVITGAAASDEAVAEPLIEALRQVVVVRGAEPKPVREPLGLTLPAELAEKLGTTAEPVDKPSAPTITI